MVGNNLKSVDYVTGMTFKVLRFSSKRLRKLASKLPNLDAYAEPYCMTIDVINQIDKFLYDYSSALQRAREHLLDNPTENSSNRARKWCGYHYDSDGKPSIGKVCACADIPMNEVYHEQAKQTP